MEQNGLRFIHFCNSIKRWLISSSSGLLLYEIQYKIISNPFLNWGCFASAIYYFFLSLCYLHTHWLFGYQDVKSSRCKSHDRLWIKKNIWKIAFSQRISNQPLFIYLHLIVHMNAWILYWMSIESNEISWIYNKHEEHN